MEECSICLDNVGIWTLAEDIEICPRYKVRNGLRNWMIICLHCKFAVIRRYFEENPALFRMLLYIPPPPPPPSDCPFGPGPRVSEGEEPLFF